MKFRSFFRWTILAVTAVSTVCAETATVLFKGKVSNEAIVLCPPGDMRIYSIEVESPVEFKGQVIEGLEVVDAREITVAGGKVEFGDVLSFRAEPEYVFKKTGPDGKSWRKLTDVSIVAKGPKKETAVKAEKGTAQKNADNIPWPRPASWDGPAKSEKPASDRSSGKD